MEDNILEDNERIKSTKCEYKGIKFDSKLEMYFYKNFESFKPLREGMTITLVEPYTLRCKAYCPKNNGKTHIWRGKTIKDREPTEIKKQLKLTYIPDFIIKGNGKVIIIELKGWQTPEYLIKRKLLLNQLTESFIFLEIGSVKEFPFYKELIKKELSL